MSPICSSLTGAGTCLEALAGALLKSRFNLLRAGGVAPTGPPRGRSWDPAGCAGRGSRASPPWQLLAGGGIHSPKSTPRQAMFFWGGGGGGSGTVPTQRLAAGNPPHPPLKGTPSFRAVPWLQPSSEDGGSEPAPRHRRSKAPGSAFPSPSRATGGSRNAETPPPAPSALGLARLFCNSCETGRRRRRKVSRALHEQRCVINHCKRVCLPARSWEGKGKPIPTPPEAVHHIVSNAAIKPGGGYTNRRAEFCF